MTTLKSIDTSGPVPVLTWETPSKRQELTDLCTEAINAVIEAQDDYARDLACQAKEPIDGEPSNQS